MSVHVVEARLSELQVTEPYVARDTCSSPVDTRNRSFVAFRALLRGQVRTNRTEAHAYSNTHSDSCTVKY